HGIVPSELRHRLGQFLQPAVVGEATVVNRWIAAEVDFDCALSGRRCRTREICVLCRNLLGLRSRAVDPTLLERLAPPQVEVGTGMFRLPVVLNDLVAGWLVLPSDVTQELDSTLAVIKRSNQRLHDADRAVISARIPPGLEVVGFRNMPVAEL